jgi:pentatricopeptide repeat domain-containing protein 1
MNDQRPQEDHGQDSYTGLFSGMSLNGNNLSFHHPGMAYHQAQPILDVAENAPVVVQQPQALAFPHPHHPVHPAWMSNTGHNAPAIIQGGPNGHHNGYSGHGPRGETRGWGGQAFDRDQPHPAPYKQMWFGKGQNGNNGGYSGGARRGRYRGGGRAGGRGYSRDSSGNVEACVRMLCQLSENEVIGEDITSMLKTIDSRELARLLKELSRMGMSSRAVELFDVIRSGSNGYFSLLLDVFTYTAAISLCITTHDVDRALRLAEEMKQKRIQCNVHTYTALMNVCIKCSRYGTALETYEMMRRDGCTPNVVTFNTLIDVYGKTGAWEQAGRVLDVMRNEGIDPVLRTYNTLLIACNMCNQPREAISAYKRMLSDGFSPNSTTYNALISAYGKSGQLDKVMEIFQEMTARGCEKNVITYSSLISACEKVGQWELALELFQEMGREHCNPNTVTFNSLITALGQGGQWEKAQSVFDQMKPRNCIPDVVTYTALISALEKGGQWKLAIDAFERMVEQRCKADAIVYNAVVNSLWETGIILAQRHALRLFRRALHEGHFPQQSLIPGLVRAEVNLHATTSGIAMLSLYVWLMRLRHFVKENGPSAVPAKISIVTDRARGVREQGNSVIKESVNAMMMKWNSPFVLHEQKSYSGYPSLEASGEELAAWVVSSQFVNQLFAFFPCSEIFPDGDEIDEVSPDGRGMESEDSTEKSCVAAFAAVKLFEETHCLVVQNMGYEYLQKRATLAHTCVRINKNLKSPEELAHDAILLMDRVMSTSLSFSGEVFDLLAASCVAIAYDHSEKESEKDFEIFEKASGLPAWAIKQMEWSIRQILNHDTQSISSIRCVKLMNERLGMQQLGTIASSAFIGNEYELCLDCISETSFLNCRPSIVAAAVIYVSRRERGAIPFWPSSLSRLTGYNDVSALELSVAIKSAQRIVSSRSYIIGSGSPDKDVLVSMPQASIAEKPDDALNADTEAILNSIYDLVSSSEFPITPEETESSAPNGSTERSTSNEGGSSNNDDGSNESNEEGSNIDGSSDRTERD